MNVPFIFQTDGLVLKFYGGYKEQDVIYILIVEPQPETEENSEGNASRIDITVNNLRLCRSASLCDQHRLNAVALTMGSASPAHGYDPFAIDTAQIQTKSPHQQLNDYRSRRDFPIG